MCAYISVILRVEAEELQYTLGAFRFHHGRAAERRTLLPVRQRRRGSWDEDR